VSKKDPYAFHAILLVYGEDRAAIARQLREHADTVERGDDGRFCIMPGAEGLRVVREAWEGQEAGGAGEEAGTCRMHAVYGDTEGGSASEPIAMFADRDLANRFASGQPLYDADDEPGGIDRCVLRADVVLSAWNSIDPDPYALEGE
jgi:hypothetical protein